MNDGITPLTPEQTKALEQNVPHQGYIHRVLVAGDQFLNVVAKGQPDETISARASRAATEHKWWGRTLSKFLNLFQSDHGAKAEASDVGRAEDVERLEEQSGNLNVGS